MAPTRAEARSTVTHQAAAVTCTEPSPELVFHWGRDRLFVRDSTLAQALLQEAQLAEPEDASRLSCVYSAHRDEEELDKVRLIRAADKRLERLDVSSHKLRILGIPRLEQRPPALCVLRQLLGLEMPFVLSLGDGSRSEMSVCVTRMYFRKDGLFWHQGGGEHIVPAVTGFQVFSRGTFGGVVSRRILHPDDLSVLRVRGLDGHWTRRSFDGVLPDIDNQRSVGDHRRFELLEGGRLVLNGTLIREVAL